MPELRKRTLGNPAQLRELLNDSFRQLFLAVIASNLRRRAKFHPPIFPQQRQPKRNGFANGKQLSDGQEQTG